MADNFAALAQRAQRAQQVAGQSMQRGGRSMGQGLGRLLPLLASMKRGGRVHKTGIYKLHRGERVVPARGRRGRRR